MKYIYNIYIVIYNIFMFGGGGGVGNSEELPKEIVVSCYLI